MGEVLINQSKHLNMINNIIRKWLTTVGDYAI